MITQNAVCQHLFTSTKHVTHLFYPEMTDALMCDCNSDTCLRSTRPAEFLLIARGRFARVRASACTQDVCTALTFEGDDLHPLRPSYLGDVHTKAPETHTPQPKERKQTAMAHLWTRGGVGGQVVDQTGLTESLWYLAWEICFTYSTPTWLPLNSVMDISEVSALPSHKHSASL